MNETNIYGPDIYIRNRYGLLENKEYIFNEDGSIDWRSMIKPEFLYPNKGWFDIRNKTVPTSVDGLEDKQLLIMLGGIKELAKLRGFISISYEINHISEKYVVAKCRINWSGNYETENNPVSYEDVANATSSNTDDFCLKFLETIACNRAFVRCVRNFLNIHIVGADEIDKSKGADNSVSVESDYDNGTGALTPSAMLEKVLKQKYNADSFDKCKVILRDLWKLESYRNEEAKNWNSYADIPAKECRKLIALLKKS